MRTLRSGELDEAAALLAAGHVVGIPTDTVYGLAACLGDPAAVDALFAAKDRPASLPIAVLCADEASARMVASSWPPGAARLAARFWPGPLTIVVPADQDVAARIHATAGIGLRVPDDATCRALLSLTGPLAVTSANRHGADPAATAPELSEGFDGGVVLAVLDAGRRGGVVSTVVDLTVSPARVVREGALASAAVLAVLD
jgi:tRNA threonylcarbamoyl adenosine modification protein (Sua5/YciO/YrdC/YwlC family)